MKRKKPLRADPEKTREWQQRSAGGLSRGSTLGGDRAKAAPRAPLRPGKRRPGWRATPELRQAILRRQRGVCLMPGCTRKVAHLHHCLPKDEWPEYRDEEDNLVGLCVQCHMDHEFWARSGDRRLPRRCLPAGVWLLAARSGGRAEAFLEKHYPAGAAPGGTRNLSEEASPDG